MSTPKDKVPELERRYPTDGESRLDTAQSLLGEGRWSEAENELTSALALRGADSVACVAGVAQARLLGRLDARGAFAMMCSLFGPPRIDNGRLHVVAALLFATPHEGLLDVE